MKSNPNHPNTDENLVSTVDELLAAGRALGNPVAPGAGHQRYAVVPVGYELRPIPLAPLLPLPDHIRQRVTLLDAESFILYVKAFRTSTARLFCAPIKLEALSQGTNGGAEFTALLDYHSGIRGTGEAGDEPATDLSDTATAVRPVNTAARRVAHVAQYPVPLSLEFVRWMSLSGKGMTQMEFVNFIEANCADVVTPDSATLMELALNFEAKTSVNFQSKVERATGGRNLVFQETVEAGSQASVGSMRVPEWLSLSLPVFEGGKTYALQARLEYRPSNGKLTITYHLQRPHQVFRVAWQDLRTEIAEALEIPILTGSVALNPGWDEAK